MKIMLVDAQTQYGTHLGTLLHTLGYSQIVSVALSNKLLASVNQHAPDLLFVLTQSPDQALLDCLRNISHIPIVCFAEQSSQSITQAAIKAGISSYIVGKVADHRIHSILETAISRFQHHQSLRDELNSCKRQLVDRKDIDKAKAVLIKQSNLSEPEAYKLLRKMAMDHNMRLGEAARHFLAAISLLGDSQQPTPCFASN